MANSKTTALVNYTTPDAVNDVIPVVDFANLQTKKITRNNFLGITGNPVGHTDTQTLSNKTIGITNILTLRDDRFTLQDDADNTKQAVFQLSGITTGTTRTYTLPNTSSTLVDLSTAQTLTSKTLTSPIINTATIANPTLTVDSISEFTGGNGVTVAGLNIKTGALNTSNSVPTAAIQASAVTFAKTSGIWWEELGRTTLGGASNTITVSSFTARQYLKILFRIINTGVVTTGIKFNNDSAANYSSRYFNNGVAGTGVSLTSISNFWNGAYGGFAEMYVNNSATQVKTGTGSGIGGDSNAANNVDSVIFWLKWVNTANQINRVDVINTGGGTFASGSEVVVLGHD